MYPIGRSLWARGAVSLCLGLVSVSCASYKNLTLPPQDQATLAASEEKKESAAPSFQAIAARGAQDDAALPADCEVTVQLKTWDGVVSSNPVCAKHEKHPVAIPQQILLKSEKATKVATARYCDPGLGRKDGGDGYVGCVWNRKFYNNYPMGFAFSTVKKAADGKAEPLGQYISMIRVLRNGRGVFTWKRAENGDRSQLDIPISAIAAPEFFRDPVDLGVYILDSGADEATAAAEENYEVTRARWADTLSHAVSQTLIATVPDAFKDDYACFSDRLVYLRAVAQGSAADADKAEKAIIADADKAKALNDAMAKAGTWIRVATDAPVNPKKDKKVGDVTPADGELVAVLDKTGTHATLYKFRAGKAWEEQKALPSDVTLMPDKKSGVVKLQNDKWKDRVFVLAAEEGKPFAVSELTERVPCTPPDDSIKTLNTTVKQEINAAIRSSAKATAAVEAYGKAKKTVEKYVGDTNTLLQKALAKLPANVQADIRSSVFWAHFVDDATATALSSATELVAAGASLKATIENTLNDPDSRLRAYQTFAGSLPTDDTLYSKPQANPAPGPGEANLPMTFYTPHQRYWLLAWNGVPIPVDKNSGVQTELRVDNLIPIVDVVGWHWQSGIPAVSNYGLGFGLLGTRESVKPENAPAYTTNFNVGAQANFSASAARVGVAYMFREADDCSTNCFASFKNVRVVVGADLIRIFTGKDTAYDTTPAAGTGADK